MYIHNRIYKKRKDNFIVYTIHAVAINLMKVSIFDIVKPSMAHSVANSRLFNCVIKILCFSILGHGARVTDL